MSNAYYSGDDEVLCSSDPTLVAGDIVKIYRPDGTEVALNLAMCSRVRVIYAIPADGKLFWTEPADGRSNPTAVQIYEIHHDGEIYRLRGDRTDPATQAVKQRFNL